MRITANITRRCFNAPVHHAASRSLSRSIATNMSLKRKAVDLAAADAKKPKANASITSFFGQPKPVAGGSSVTKATAPVKFDKDEWVAKLTDEQKELLKLEIDTLHESWLAHLKDEIVTKEFLELKRFLKREVESGKKIFPPMEDVYSWYALPHDSNKSQSYTIRSRDEASYYTHTPFNINRSTY